MVVATVLFVLIGLRSATRLPMDAVPDITNTQVQIVNNLVSHNLRERDGNPEEVLAGNLAGASPGWFQSIAQGDLHLVGEALPPVDAGAATKRYPDLPGAFTRLATPGAWQAPPDA